MLPSLHYFRPVSVLWGVIWRYSARRFMSFEGVRTVCMYVCMYVTRDSRDKTENMSVWPQEVMVLTGREFITSLKKERIPTIPHTWYWAEQIRKSALYVNIMAHLISFVESEARKTESFSSVPPGNCRDSSRLLSSNSWQLTYISFSIQKSVPSKILFSVAWVTDGLVNKITNKCTKGNLL